MDKIKMKNVVVLKNLPSNLVEEAFVVVKSKKIARKLEYIDNKKNGIKKDEKDKEYVIREAESVLSDYVNLIEKKEKNNVHSLYKKRYNFFKIYGIIITIVLIISCIY